MIPIEHVVLLIKENHCFDNYFGTFPGANGMIMPRAANLPPPAGPGSGDVSRLVRRLRLRLTFPRRTPPPL